MRHGLYYALRVMVLGLLGFAASLANAQTTANGPYYATPSWDQTLPSSTRFIVLSNFNNEAVLDRETGLVWERSPSSFTDTFDRSDYCVSASTGGKFGWRTPSVYELSTLIDTTQSSPKLPSGHPFLNLGGGLRFWTSTPFSVGLGAVTAWVVLFDLGGVGTNGVTATWRFWCVRAAGGTPPIAPTLQ
jgi:Protein of unknown function (DUF1566)